MVVDPYTFTNLDKEKYISLTTFRKTEKAVTTPVWFAESMGTIYAEIGVNAGKLKRIRHTERVTLAACTLSGKVKGSEVEGKARILSEPQEIHTAKATMSKKYGLPRSISYFLLNTISTMLRKPRMNLVYIAIDSVTV